MYIHITMNSFTDVLKSLVSPVFDEQLLIQIIQNTFNLKNAVIDDISHNSDCKKGDSYLSTVTRFIIKASGIDERNGQSRNITLPIIAKALPGNLGRRKTFRSLEFFKNEVHFYNIVWKAMNKFQESKNSKFLFKEIPLCVSALADGQYDYVALEDLSFKGYTCVARANGFDFTHAQFIIKLFAKFHAVGLAFKDQQPKEFEEAANQLQETYFSESHRSWYSNFQTQMLYPVICDAVEKQLPEYYLIKVKELFASDFYGTLINQCAERGRLAVITHGDTWIPNFLIKYDDNKMPLDAFIIDFQLARYASLALDIMFFLYSCTEKPLWDQYWDILIETYHKTVTNTLEQLGSSTQLLTLDDLKLELRKCAVFGIGMSMEAITMSILEDDETADLDLIQGDDGVPLETVWIVRPFKSEAKRQRLADLVKHAVDNGFM